MPEETPKEAWCAVMPALEAGIAGPGAAGVRVE